MIYSIAIFFILSGVLLDTANEIFTIPFSVWEGWYFLTRDLRLFGAFIIAFNLCPYQKLKTKTMLFLFMIYQYVVCIINTTCYENLNMYFIYGFVAVFLVWSARIFIMDTIKDSDPGEQAFYILYPVSTINGLIQAIFMPWHSARYETRMISDGCSVWLIHNGVFVKKKLSEIKFNVKGTRKPIGRKLKAEEYALLNGMVGEKATPGISDCRRYLIAGRV